MNMWIEQHETMAEVSAVNLTDDKKKSALQEKKENSGDHQTRNGSTGYSMRRGCPAGWNGQRRRIKFEITNMIKRKGTKAEGRFLFIPKLIIKILKR